MKVIPAVDIRAGRVIRLIRGSRDAEIVYDPDPVAVALRWVGEGADYLHIIDLGAVLGESHNRPVIKDLLAAIGRRGARAQVGGGIRTRDTVAEVLGTGADRVIIGTRAFTDPSFLGEVVREFGPERIVVALDMAGDRIRIAGWEEDSPIGFRDALERIRDAGAQRALVTAIDRDGTLTGPDRDHLRAVLRATPIQVIASGGVSTLDDIVALKRIDEPNLEAVVVGRVLYEGQMRLPDALRAAED